MRDIRSCPAGLLLPALVLSMAWPTSGTRGAAPSPAATASTTRLDRDRLGSFLKVAQRGVEISCRAPAAADAAGRKAPLASDQEMLAATGMSLPAFREVLERLRAQYQAIQASSRLAEIGKVKPRASGSPRASPGATPRGTAVSAALGAMDAQIERMELQALEEAAARGDPAEMEVVRPREKEVGDLFELEMKLRPDPLDPFLAPRPTPAPSASPTGRASPGRSGQTRGEVSR
ncbi:MAG: hypothetical protein HY815_02975 [Candidatus Riflebacteria bacterium]|nr:hypothetical protein [Candidatus Riflebacteria bacterium]